MLQARWNRGCDSKTLSRLRVARLIPRPTPTCSQYRFKSKGARGKQVSKYIPPSAVARVKKLIENGRRYRKLEAEYSRLVTEASLAALKKKTAGEG